MTTEDVIKLYDRYVMPTYNRFPLILTKGKGMKVFDLDGKEYLDFFPGWGVSGLGHCHPRIVKAVRSQANKIMHVSNNYYNVYQAKLARIIAQRAFDGKVFFANSGAEANEAAIKLARRYGKETRNQIADSRNQTLPQSGSAERSEAKPDNRNQKTQDRYEIITFENSFHGRTIATISATGQQKYKEGFEPLLEGFKILPFNDLAAVKSNISDKTVAIMLEPIQGEGGINVASKEFLLGLRKLCDEKKCLLILDEVQTGMGRTGKMFGYQHYDGLVPDVMTLAKSLGGGLAMSAMLAKRAISDSLAPGSHASTFGGNPLAGIAGCAVFEAIDKEKLLDNALEMGEYFMKRLLTLKEHHPIINQIRGMGLMLGIELACEGKPIFERCLKQGLLINCTQGRVLRLMPALNVKKEQIDKAMKILEEALKP